MGAKGILMTFEFAGPTLAELREEKKLTAAEEMLLEGRFSGEMMVLGPPRPEVANDGNAIRAGLIRYLMLGGCEEARPHPKGVQVAGAYVEDVLDLEACKSPLELGAVESRFAETPVLMDAELGQVWLDGSALPGLNAERMIVQRSVMDTS